MEKEINKNILRIVGTIIRERRNALGLTQSMLADRLGTSTPAISKIEAGVTDVNLSRLTQVATALELDVTSLFPDQEIKRNQSETLFAVIQKRIANREEEILTLQRKVIHLYEEIRKK